MLRYIKLYNFQIHECLTVPLSPQVTVLTGRTNAGKSSVVRALRWLLFNKPVAHFRRTGSKVTYVEIGVDGHRIRRTRTDTKNTISLDGKIFKAVGRDVPAPIVNILKVAELTVARQHDEIFWVSDSGGEASRRLNQIVDLQSIDRTVSNLNSGLREVVSRVAVTKDRKKDALAECKSLQWAKLQDEELTGIEELRARRDQFDAKADLLRRIAEEAQTASGASQTREKAVSAQKAVVAVGHEWARSSRIEKGLSAVVGDVARWERGIADNEVEMVALEKTIKQAFGRQCPLCGKATL